MRNLLLAAAASLVLAACGQGQSIGESETTAPAPQAVETALPAAPINVYVNADGVAAGGYDVVSFQQGAGAPGLAEFTSEHQGAKYQFVSAENKAVFDAEPAKYVPAYGGFCAYGAAYGGKYHTDPTTGQVINGKLYFNKNADVKKLFDKDAAANIGKADAQWPTIEGEPIKG